MRIALNDWVLPGATFDARCAVAQAAGAHGLELNAARLENDWHECAAALERHGLQAAAIMHDRDGSEPSILDPDPAVRNEGLRRLHRSIDLAGDLGAAGVILVPAWGDLTLPDLMPYKSPAALAADLLLNHLRTLEDYAMAMGTAIWLAPHPPECTTFVTRHEQAAHFVRARNNPYVRVAVEWSVALHEGDPAAIVAQMDGLIGGVRVDARDVAVAGQTLRAAGYDGWMSITAAEACDLAVIGARG